MAGVLLKQGNYEEALVIYREVLDIRERVLGKEHPDTLTDRNIMALMLATREVFKLQESVLPSLSELSIRNNLSRNNQGQYDDEFGLD